MSDSEDWLQDPLMKLVKGSRKRRKLKKPKDAEQNDRWWSFHFATRLKLDGADYFCRQALGAASMPDNLGLHLLAHRQLEWYLGAFFFELMSAYDTLLQELNIVYGLELKPGVVSWNKIKDKLPRTLVKYMKDERGKDWFYEIRSHRNLATHHYVIPLGSSKAGVGDDPLDYREYTVSIYCIDKTGNIKVQPISICIDYLKQMAKYIKGAWQEMAQEFQ